MFNPAGSQKNTLLIGAAALVLAAACAAAVPFAEDTATELLPGVEQFNAAYLAWDLAGFQSAAAVFEKACAAHPDSPAAHYWLGAARFHVFLHRHQDAANPPKRDEFKELALGAEAPLQQAVALDGTDSESHALLATLYGIQISRSPWRSLALGKKVSAHSREAMKHGPGNPRCYFLLGTGHFNAPGIWGKPEKALDFFLKAEGLFREEAKSDRPPLAPAWGRGACLTFAAMACQRMGREREAADCFRRALEVNPLDRRARAGLDATDGTGERK